MSTNPNDEDYDEALCRYRGYCRGCKQVKNHLSGDNGICGDCD